MALAPGSRLLQSPLFTIGTRGSPLALAQAGEVRARIADRGLAGEDEVAIRPIRTTGDRITDRPLAEAGGKGLFTKEIDEALLAGEVDLAVHSAKDLPTRLPDGIVIAACLPRGDVRDALIAPRAASLRELPQGAVLGTSALRRAALALRARPDLRIVNLRGNVETRLRKLADGVADATLLAAAGLARLGLLDRATAFLAPEDWLPAVGQGVIVVTARTGDARILRYLAAIDHRETHTALDAERAFLAVLDGSCRTPIGGYAAIASGSLHFRGIIITPDGREAHEVERSGPVADAQAIGADAGADLAKRGGPGFFGAHA